MLRLRSGAARRASYVVSCVACLTALCRPVAAQSGLTLDAAIRRALDRNPDVLVARLHVDSTIAERRIAGALPNPLLTATPANPSQYAVQLPLDFTVARHFRIQATSRAVDASRLDTRDAERQTVFAVRQAFYDVLLADSLRAVASDEAQTFRQLLSADSVRLRGGSIAERDVVTTRLQLAHAEAVLARAAVQQHATRIALETLIGIPELDTTLLITGGLRYQGVAVSVDSILTLALVHRPDLAAASSRTAQSGAAVSLARASLVPVPLVGAVYQPAQPFASGSHWAPSVGLSIPVLYAFRGERNRAAASLEAARITEDRTRRQVRADVTLAMDSYYSSRALADRYACGLLADATDALEAARYAYDRGATGLPDFLEAVRAYVETRSDYLTAVHDYWVSLFAVERAAGVDFLPSSR